LNNKIKSHYNSLTSSTINFGHGIKAWSRPSTCLTKNNLFSFPHLRILPITSWPLQHSHFHSTYNCQCKRLWTLKHHASDWRGSHSQTCQCPIPTHIITFNERVWNSSHFYNWSRCSFVNGNELEDCFSWLEVLAQSAQLLTVPTKNRYRYFLNSECKSMCRFQLLNLLRQENEGIFSCWFHTVH